METNFDGTPMTYQDIQRKRRREKMEQQRNRAVGNWKKLTPKLGKVFLNKEQKKEMFNKLRYDYYNNKSLNKSIKDMENKILRKKNEIEDITKPGKIFKGAVHEAWVNKIEPRLDEIDRLFARIDAYKQFVAEGETSMQEGTLEIMKSKLGGKTKKKRRRRKSTKKKRRKRRTKKKRRRRR